MTVTRIFWWSIPLVIVLSFVSTLYRNTQVPSRQEWQEAIGWVDTQWQEGDQITWYPEWVSEGKIFLHHLSAFHPPYQGEIDLGYAKRTWVLTTMGYNAKDWIDGIGLQPLQKVKIVESKHIGPIHLSALEVIEGHSYADLYQQWSDKDRVQVTRIKHSKQQKSKISTIESKLQKCEVWALQGWHCKTAHQQKRIDQCLSKPLKKKLKFKSRRRDIYTLDRRRFLPYVDCGLDPVRHVTRDARVIADEPRRCIAMTPVDRDQIMIHWNPKLNLNKRASSQASYEIWLDYGWEDLAVNHPFRDSRTKEAVLQISLGQSIWKQTVATRLGWQRVRRKLTTVEQKELSQNGIQMKVQALEVGDQDSVFCMQMSIRQSTNTPTSSL